MAAEAALEADRPSDPDWKCAISAVICNQFKLHSSRDQTYVHSSGLTRASRWPAMNKDWEEFA